MPSKEILDGAPFADYRQLTGKLAYNAYVYVKNKVVRACDHEHRKASAAKVCANKMLAAYVNADCPGFSLCDCAKCKLSPRLIGIVHLWIRNVRITGYGARPNEYIPAGTVGDMEVIETSTDGRVLNARFHPGGEGKGYGLVTWPHWECVKS